MIISIVSAVYENLLIIVRIRENRSAEVGRNNFLAVVICNIIIYVNNFTVGESVRFDINEETITLVSNTA